MSKLMCKCKDCQNDWLVKDIKSAVDICNYCNSDLTYRFIIDSSEDTKLNMLDPFEARVAEILALYRSKNSDYTGDNPDILATFREYTSLGITIHQGIEARLVDKEQRIKAMLRGHKAHHEALRDTLLDRINYSLFALTAYDEEHKEES